MTAFLNNNSKKLRDIHMIEGLILEITECIAKLMNRRALSYKEIAKVAGIKKKRFKRIMKGTEGTTLYELGLIFQALQVEPKLVLNERCIAVSPTTGRRCCKGKTMLRHDHESNTIYDGGLLAREVWK